jgi:hypothetical protein
VEFGRRESFASATAIVFDLSPPRLVDEHLRPRRRHVRPVGAATFGILCRGEVSEWLMVPLSKSGVRKHRGFESRPLRHRLDRQTGRPAPCRSASLFGAGSWRGRLVDYGAALEMRFGATRRGFESRPLRHLRHPGGRPWVRWLTPVLAHARPSALAAVLVGRLPLNARPGGWRSTRFPGERPCVRWPIRSSHLGPMASRSSALDLGGRTATPR